MYICLCHGITDRQIRSCIESGARTLCDLSGELGVATQCGSCAGAACEMLDEAAARGETARFAARSSVKPAPAPQPL